MPYSKKSKAAAGGLDGASTGTTPPSVKRQSSGNRLLAAAATRAKAAKAVVTNAARERAASISIPSPRRRKPTFDALLTSFKINIGASDLTSATECFSDFGERQSEVIAGLTGEERVAWLQLLVNNDQNEAAHWCLSNLDSAAATATFEALPPECFDRLLQSADERQLDAFYRPLSIAGKPSNLDDAAIVGFVETFLKKPRWAQAILSQWLASDVPDSGNGALLVVLQYLLHQSTTSPLVWAATQEDAKAAVQSVFAGLAKVTMVHDLFGDFSYFQEVFYQGFVAALEATNVEAMNAMLETFRPDPLGFFSATDMVEVCGTQNDAGQTILHEAEQTEQWTCLKSMVINIDPHLTEAQQAAWFNMKDNADQTFMQRILAREAAGENVLVKLMPDVADWVEYSDLPLKIEGKPTLSLAVATGNPALVEAMVERFKAQGKIRAAVMVTDDKYHRNVSDSVRRTDGPIAAMMREYMPERLTPTASQSSLPTFEMQCVGAARPSAAVENPQAAVGCAY